MHFWKKFSLVAFFASMITALQGCSLRDSATALLILIAFILPGCPVQDELDAIAVGSSFVSTTITCSVVAGCPFHTLFYDVPAAKILHITCHDVSQSSSSVRTVKTFAIESDMTNQQVGTTLLGVAGTLVRWEFIDADTLANINSLTQGDFCTFLAES